MSFSRYNWSKRALSGAVTAAVTFVVCASIGVSTATAVDFGVDGFDVTFANQDGSPATQAGSHPFQTTTSLFFNGHDTNEFPDGGLRDGIFEQIAGLVADPNAVPRCSNADFVHLDPLRGFLCADRTAVGVAALSLSPGGIQYTPIVSLDPPPGFILKLGFVAFNTPVTIDIGLTDTYPYKGVAVVSNTPQSTSVLSSVLTLWGNPNDPAHDPYRGFCVSNLNGTPDTEYPDLPTHGNCPTDAPDVPLLTLPRACVGPLESTYRVVSWRGTSDEGNVFTHDNAEPSNPQGMTGCSKLGFSPTIGAKPTTTAADSPSGLDFSLDVADEGLTSRDGLAQSDIKKTVVTLPEGVSVNPAVAGGLGACTQADLARETLDSAPGAGCPESSKIGSVQVETPLLDESLSGSLFAAKQGDNPFNSLLAFYLVVENRDLGIIVKQPVKVQPNEVTGQLIATTDEIPQLPFSHFKLHFNQGARAPLTSPSTCGNFAAEAELMPWSGTAPISTSSSFQITSGIGGGACPAADPAARPFGPSLSAGVTSPKAGASSPFSLRLTRPDADQALKGLDVDLPQGMAAKLAGVPKCSEAAIASVSTAVGSGQGEIASPSCPAGSLLGSATVGSGVGPSPFFVQTGKVYFAGPYKGAPFSLAVVTPAVAGPFDLGNVVVRAGLYVDPVDAHVTVKTDPLPTILAGVPLQIQEIRTVIDKPGFMLSPTDCDPMRITGQARSEHGVVAPIGDRFQVGECSSLDLKPKLAIALTGKGQTTDDKHPGVHATVSQPAGQSNLRKVTVSLPLSLALDPDNAQALCEFTDGSKIDPTCPKASIVGKAVARTPILDQPLTGPVYFVKNIRKDPKSGREIRTLPKLVIPLTGENGLRLNLVGTSNVVDNRLVTTFDNIPDAPVSDFTLDIDGGKSGILVVSGTDICKSTQVAEQQIDGQNGKNADADVYLQTPACPLKIISKKVGKSSVAVKIGGLGAGKVTVSGKGIKKTTKTISKSTVATVTAKRTRGKQGKVKVSFDPTGPAKARKTTK